VTSVTTTARDGSRRWAECCGQLWNRTITSSGRGTRTEAEEVLASACEYLADRAYEQLDHPDQPEIGDWDAYATIKQRLDEMVEYDNREVW
jgi:hypothetical protein